MFNKILSSILVFALFFFAWESASRSFDSLKFVLPPPSLISFTLWKHADRFYFHSISTIYEMVGGVLLALAAAFPLAWLMSYFGPFRAILQPLFVAIQCVPMFALAPLMVLWFSWSYIAIVVPTALMIFFPLTINIYRGLCATPKDLLDFFFLHKATAWQTFYKLQLPCAMPHIFAGFRIAVAAACIGAVAGEWAGAQQGLGLLMLESRRSADLEMLFGALTCVTFISLILYAGATLLEKSIGVRYYRSRQDYQKNTTRIPLAAFMLFSILSFGTGCQPSSPQREVRMVLDWLPNPNHVALYGGIEKGIFKKHQIDLKILKIADSSDGIPFLTSEQAEVCLSYMPRTMQALAKGAKIEPIAILVQAPLNAFIFRANEGIVKPKDLNKQVLGYCVTGYETKVLANILKSHSIIPESYKNVSFDLIGTLATRQVDVVYGAYWNIELENMRALGLQVDYFPLKDFNVPDYYELIVLSRRDSEQAKPQFVEAFQKALQESIHFAIANPEEAFDYYLKANPDKSLKTQKWEREAWYKTIPVLAKDQKIDPELWNRFLSWFIDNGVIEADKKDFVFFK